MSGNDETLTLLPDNATAFEACQSAVDQRLLAAPTDIIRTEREAATCSAAFLPFLAWERSVHHWTGNDEDLDRARTGSSFEDHANYGSPPALEDELQIDLAWPDVRIREFFEVKGFEWPDFQVVIGIAPDGPTPPVYADVRAAAIKRKNVRDWPGGLGEPSPPGPAGILYEAAQSGPFPIGVAAGLNATINLLPFAAKPQNLAGLYVGVAVNVTGTINLRPF